MRKKFNEKTFILNRICGGETDDELYWEGRSSKSNLYPTQYTTTKDPYNLAIVLTHWMQIKTNLWGLNDLVRGAVSMVA